MCSSSATAGGNRPRLRAASATGMLALLLALWPLRRAQAENRAEYRFSDYIEDSDRIKVQTHSVWFEYDLQSKVALHGSYVNDAISGATPTGGLVKDAAGKTLPELVTIKDERNAGFLETAIRAGRTTTTPQISYSEESDYRSLGLSLTEAIDFNERNTTLILGLARNNDSVGKSSDSTFWRYKGSWDAMIGLNQILGPKTVMTANLTFGYSDGFLADPYKGIGFVFDLPPAGDSAFDTFTFDSEHRPHHKFKQVLFLGLNQAVPQVDASLDLGYRFHHDDWGTIANTGEVTWHQRLFKRVTVSPMFRYHRQTAADFYMTKINSDPALAGSRIAFTPDDQPYAVEGDGVFESDVLTHPGDFNIVSVPTLPRYYSADYRLSELETFTYGVTVAIKLCEKATLNLGYQRYEMHGLDGVTPQSVYPRAHVFSIGLGATF